MFNMMRADLYRILKGRAIYIILAIIILMSTVSIIGMSSGYIGLSVGSNNSTENIEWSEKLETASSLKEYRKIMKNQGEFELDKDILGQNANLYYIFIVIVVIVLTTDFSAKTIKNTLSSAITRKQYYFSKLILILGLCTFIILFNNYFVYFSNLIINGRKFSSSLGDITKITLVQLPLLYGIISLLVFLAFIFQKTSTFNTISIPFIMVIQLIVTGIASLFKLKIDWFYNYEFQSALNNLVHNSTNNYILKCALLGIIYILVFNLIGYYSFKKSEIN